MSFSNIKGSLVHKLANIVGNVEIGQCSRIDAFVTITGNVRLGKKVHISTGACIFGGEGVEIGDYSGLSPGVKVFTSTEDLSGDSFMHPTSEKNRTPQSSPVFIGKHCTIGANSVVLPGSYLHDGSCVGALSLVKGTLFGWAVYAGIPVKKLKDRSKKVLELE